MDNWVVAPVARWLQRQDLPVLATNLDVTVADPSLPPVLTKDEQGSEDLPDTGTQASTQPVLDSIPVSDPVAHLQPPQNEQQQQQPFSAHTEGTVSTTVATTSPRAEDNANSPTAWMPSSPDQSRVSCHGR